MAGSEQRNEEENFYDAVFAKHTEFLLLPTAAYKQQDVLAKRSHRIIAPRACDVPLAEVIARLQPEEGVIALGPGIDQLVREYTRVADERKAGAAVLEEPFGKGDADAEIIMNLNKYILPGGYLLLGAGFRPQEIERVFNGLRPFAEPGIVYDAHQLAFKMAKNSVVLTRILKREA